MAVVLGVGTLAANAVLAADPANRFYVYRDADFVGNRGEWTNWFPAASGSMLKLDMVDRSNPALGSTAVRVDVAIEPPGWAGIAVASQPDYWGETPSDQAFDLGAATALVFYARGARGGEQIQVKVALAGDKAFGDSRRRPFVTEWISLGREWKRYELPVTGSELRRVITPFAFVVDRGHGGSQPFTFYLDEIYFSLAAK